MVLEPKRVSIWLKDKTRDREERPNSEIDRGKWMEMKKKDD